jgi:aryl-alcohol dehydrogenase-like predicted oxidoreductase
MQGHYSLLYREEEREMNAYCNFAGIGLIPWGPLNAGRLARPLTESTIRSEGRKSQQSEAVRPRSGPRICTH